MNNVSPFLATWEVTFDLLHREIPENSNASSYVSRMQDAARRMSILIDDLLTFSQFSSKPIEFTKLDLNEIVARVLSDLETSIEQAQAAITIFRLPSLKGDDRQLSQLFQNLLSNAIKFRRQDVLPEIQINWSIVKATTITSLLAENTLVKAYDRIDVSDNGIGLDKRHEDRIFKVFQRLHGKSEYEGTGIGLAICEKVVTNHNGIISVESQLGIGTTFSVFFPIS